MGVHFATFLFTSLLMIAWPFAAQAKMFADCTFGKINTTEGQKMTANFTAKLAAFMHISHSCFLKTDGQNHFLQVRAKRNKESKGFLHVSAYGTDESRILGHLDLSTSEADWSSLIVCPSRYSYEVHDKHLIFSGSPNLSFSVQIDSSPREIKLNEPQTVRVTPENVQVFQFFPPEDIAKTQLDITVTSESADVPAYLKVSRVCEEVDKDDIDEVDYKGESVRLSFAKKGRITLSKVSVPPLTDSTSSWFIGIAIKNATGETPFNATKSVTLELNKSFNFSYALPIFLLVFFSMLFGGLIAYGAYKCFENEPPPMEMDTRGTQTELCTCERGNNRQITSSRVPNETDSMTASDQSSIPCEPNTALKETQTELCTCEPREQNQASPSIAERNPTTSQGTENEVELGEPTQPSSSEVHVTERTRLIHQPEDSFRESPPINKTPCKDLFLNWFKHGPKTYSYTAAIVGFMLMIGAGQFVFANWHLMREEGDRDNCYYNDFCYRVSHWHDIPLNLMISNVVYIIHGLILGTLVCCWEAKVRKKYLFAPGEQAFSIGYAFAWAMIFEGLFSLVYHLCPSKLTFQFDTAFMFVIAGLIVISLYNGTATNAVGAANLFLYFLVPLFIFNYLGAVRHQSETGLPTLLHIGFFFALPLWFIIICIWVGFKLDFSCNNFCQKAICRKKVWFAIGVVIPVISFFPCLSDLPQAFLISCIAESFFAILIKFLYPCKCSECKCPECKYLVVQVVYVVITVILWGFALYYFFFERTTDKVETPEKSRNLNQDCITGGFFDYHDLWHILSSHALLMTVCFVIFMSHKGRRKRA